MIDLLTLIADTADELTQPQRHVEQIGYWDTNRNRKVRRHIVMLPSLLEQLAEAVVPGESYVEDDTARLGFGSRPAARLDAIDRLLAIEAGAITWCRTLRLALRDEPTANIRAMVGGAGVCDSDARRRMLADLSAWRTWAQTVTGWIRPPDVPRAPCPLCAQRGSLRVRLDRQTACCVACGGAWDATTIGLLARHVSAFLAASEAAGRVARLKAVEARRDDEARRAGAA